MIGSAQVDVRRSREFWFDDGNVVLIASNVGYRLHGGVLARHSPVFRDMLSFPQPDYSDEKIDGCPVVHLTEEAEDLERVLYILYDGGVEFYNATRTTSFALVSAALEFGSKYQIESIRQEALRRLRICFPPTLAAFHSENTPEGVLTHLPASSMGCQERPIVIYESNTPAVVNLARKFDLPELLPAAFYVCSTLPVTILLSPRPSDRADERLTPSDLCLCFQVRDAMFEQCSRQLSFLFDNGPQQRDGPCTNVVTCDRLREQAMDLAYGDSGQQALVHPRALVSWARWLDGLGFCPACNAAIMEEYHRRREEIWALLGKLVGVSPWPPDPV